MTTLKWSIGTLLGVSLAGGIAIRTLNSAEEPAPAETANATKKVDAPLEKPSLPRWHKNLADWKALEDSETADNSFCYVCHLNYEEEELTKIHMPHGVGCETCHGISDKHSEDEDSVIPPDVMFPKQQIITFCSECHSKEDLEGQEEHDELFATKKSKKTCADCHAEKHRLEVRTRKWNKQTGKLMWDDGVRMMEER